MDIEALAAQLAEIRGKLDALLAAGAAAAHTTEGPDRLTEIEKHLSRVEERLAGLDETLKAAGNLAEVRSSIIPLWTSIEEIVTKLDGVTTSLRRLADATAQIARLQGVLDGRLTAEANEFRKLKQTTDQVARWIPRPKGRAIRCLFLVHHIEAWDALADVYLAMRAANDFDPIVASVPRVFPGSNTLKDEDVVHAGLEHLGIPHLRLNTGDPLTWLDAVKMLAPDILFRQAPWDRDVPEVFRTEELGFAKLCYIPYGFMSIENYWADGRDAPLSFQTDQAFHRACWRIFCETEIHRQMFAAHSLVGAHHVVVAGYPKFDRLLHVGREAPHWPIDRGARAFRVIWAPHHSVAAGWLGFGTFVEVYRDMLNLARSRNDLEIVLKPHPGLFDFAVTVKRMSQQEVDAFQQEWTALPNTALITGGDYGPLFAASDVMVSDGISFIYEYQLFDKPLIFIDSGRHVAFNAAGARAVTSAYTATDFNGVLAHLQALRSGADPLRAERQLTIAQIMPYPGQSVARILAAIREGLDRNPEGS